MKTFVQLFDEALDLGLAPQTAAQAAQVKWDQQAAEIDQAKAEQAAQAEAEAAAKAEADHHEAVKTAQAAALDAQLKRVHDTATLTAAGIVNGMSDAEIEERIARIQG